MRYGLLNTLALAAQELDQMAEHGELMKSLDTDPSNPRCRLGDEAIERYRKLQRHLEEFVGRFGQLHQCRKIDLPDGSIGFEHVSVSAHFVKHNGKRYVLEKNIDIDNGTWTATEVEDDYCDHIPAIEAE